MATKIPDVSPYNDLLDSEQFHNSDIVDDGPAINAVRFVRVNKGAAAQRNIGYIRENIARRLEHEKLVKENISSLQA